MPYVVCALAWCLQVLGHIHQTAADGFVGKTGVLQALGHYDWQLAHKVKGEAGVFQLSAKMGQAVPKVVAMHPAVNWQRLLQSEEDFKVGVMS